ncbi:hypothetical protein MLD38_015980 [Melastoma candidum]|uniref:Uncharacterized protein n=1 Tax=Melastoma candidum TaxID=119954 RepID=A0ACB9RH64_9MYRT|nr:hypothetical protein MLD38_015980 [Melastoma candidum]
MDSYQLLPPEDQPPCVYCGCSCRCLSECASSSAWLRSVKRKYDEYQENKKFFIPGQRYDVVARVQIENEIMALREMVADQQKAINALGAELEEERNASSSAASEAMSMILKLQREKAEIQMEARQYKAFAEERMEHDEQGLLALDDLLFKKEQAIQSLICEVQAYRHRMLSYGIPVMEVGGDSGGSSSYGHSNPGSDENFNEYPPLKCRFNVRTGIWEEEEEDDDDDVTDIEKYAHGETPVGRGQLKDLEFRIHQIEQNSSNNQWDAEEYIPEKIIVGQSPLHPVHRRELSNDSVGTRSMLGKQRVFDVPFDSPKYSCSFDTLIPDNLKTRKHNNTPDADGDDISHSGTCIIDSVYPGNQDPDIAKLYMRLQALEADRESLKQAIVSIQTDKAEMLRIKEIAQRLCEDTSSESSKPVAKRSVFGGFFGLFKWVMHVPFCRMKDHHSKYTFGISPDKIHCSGVILLSSLVGCLLLLNKRNQTHRRRLPPPGRSD